MIAIMKGSGGVVKSEMRTGIEWTRYLRIVWARFRGRRGGGGRRPAMARAGAEWGRHAFVRGRAAYPPLTDLGRVAGVLFVNMVSWYIVFTLP